MPHQGHQHPHQTNAHTYPCLHLHRQIQEDCAGDDAIGGPRPASGCSNTGPSTWCRGKHFLCSLARTTAWCQRHEYGTRETTAHAGFPHAMASRRHSGRSGDAGCPLVGTLTHFNGPLGLPQHPVESPLLPSPPPPQHLEAVLHCGAPCTACSSQYAASIHRSMQAGYGAGA